MNRAILMCAVLTLLCAGMVLAGEAKLTGKVTAVAGDVITIEVEQGKGAGVAVGAAVEVEVKKGEAKAPKKGGDMLQGC